jgi:poly-gamma-glutamate synthesis protein (capsule biosynthesis protein)
MAATAGAIRIAAMGDVMLARDVGSHYASVPEDFRMPDIRRLLAGFDLVCLNLENPVGVTGLPDPVQDPHITFRARPETLDVLKGLGVTLVSLGNNHMLDYGPECLAETLTWLDAAGIKWVGAGRNYEEANRPLLLEVKGRRLAVLSYAFIYSANTRMAGRRSAGVADHRLGRILPRIRALARAGYEVIVSIHWGKEYSLYPLPYQMRQARRMVDEGAALILGHGPHYPQGVEQYGRARIVYSMGNFIFDEPQKFARRSFIYGAQLDASAGVVRSEIYPVHLERHVPQLVDGDRKMRLQRLVDNLGAAYPKKDRRFWTEVSRAYLTDLGGRVIRSRSLKYLRVPPWAFYRDVGLAAIARKLKPANIGALLRR